MKKILAIIISLLIITACEFPSFTKYKNVQILLSYYLQLSNSEIHYSIKNISNRYMDDIVLTFYIANESNNENRIDVPIPSILKPQQTITGGCIFKIEGDLYDFDFIRATTQGEVLNVISRKENK